MSGITYDYMEQYIIFTNFLFNTITTNNFYIQKTKITEKSFISIKL